MPRHEIRLEEYLPEPRITMKPTLKLKASTHAYLVKAARAYEQSPTWVVQQIVESQVPLVRLPEPTDKPQAEAGQT